MKLYKTESGIIVEVERRFYRIDQADWDELINRDDLVRYIEGILGPLTPLSSFSLERGLLAPIGSQEVWAAGVTYYRSRTARIEESQSAGGGDFYDRVYTAERPELFFKAAPHRVAGSGQRVRIRRDSKWNVPEPELALVITSGGRIIGYTIGNDMSSRDIEGENPLYLPQAKVYDRSCALGPGILVIEPLPRETEIKLEITRAGELAFSETTSIASIKRSFESLVEFLFRDNSFPKGCFLLTGTGIVPPDSFTLQSGDTICITIDPIGSLANVVE
ncbi:MAG TPA: fumarylacetoacetate hydrolase family protein [Blastocatellia bacterium]|nr:fumarylacetoacetate hydrolase family protein [Blastocatellia bacterium]